MATYAVTSLQPQYIAQPASEMEHQVSDSGRSSAGASPVEMNQTDSSDDASSSSSHPSPPPESPTPSQTHPPPRTSSPPDQPPSLQADSPTELEAAAIDAGTPEAEGTPSGDTPQSPGPERKEFQPGIGYQAVPIDPDIANKPHYSVFVHVETDDTVQFNIAAPGTSVRMQGPGTVRAIATYETVCHHLSMSIPEPFHMYQFPGPEGLLRHIVIQKKSATEQLSPDKLDERVAMLKDIPTLQFQQNEGAGPRNNGRGGRGQHTNNHRSYQGNSRNGNSNQRNQNPNDRDGNYAGGNDSRPNELLIRSEFPPLVPTASVDENPKLQFDGLMPMADISPNEAHNIKPLTVQDVEATMVPNMPTNVPPTMPPRMPPAMPPSMPPSVPPNMPQAMMPNVMPTIMPNMMTNTPPNMPPNMEMVPVAMQNSPDSLIGQPQGMPMNDFPVAVYQQNMALCPQINGGSPPGVYGYVDHHHYNNNNNNNWKYPIPGEDETLTGVLGTIKTPTFLRPFPTGGEFAFELIKLNNFQYFQGIKQFNHVPIKDLAYYVLVTDVTGASALNTKLDKPKIEANLKATFILNTLRPNTNYKVCLYAALVSRGIFGKQTEPLTFTTSPGRPDAPTKPEIYKRGYRYFFLKWRAAVNNGAFVCMYHVYIYEDQFGNGRMLKTTDEKIEINGLEPATRYKILIYALNALGESFGAAEIDAWTKSDERPLPPQNLNVVPISNHCLELTWTPDFNSTFSVELYPPPPGYNHYIREGFRNANTILKGLVPNTVYQVRLIARSEYGEAFTNWIDARTQTTRHAGDPNEKANIEGRTPAKPKFHSYIDNVPKMIWGRFGDNGDYTYIVQGSTFEAPDDFIELHHGSGISYLVEDTTIHYLRVVHSFCGNIRSLPSPKAVVPRDYSKYRPERIKEVKVSFKREGEVLVEFTKLDIEKMNIPETAKLVYFAQRCDSTDNDVLIVGDANSCIFEDVPGEIKVEVQVRASVLFHGVLTHGDWSIPVHCFTPRYLPPPAINLKFTLSTSTLSWDCTDQSSDLFFIVNVIQLSCSTSILKLRTRLRNLVVDNLQLGEKYTASISPGTTVGVCQQTAKYEFLVPPQKPTVTSNVTVTSQINSLAFEWDESTPNGSAIKEYQLVLFLDDVKVDDKVIKINGKTKLATKFENLTADSGYSLKFIAKNSVGYSEKPEMFCRTLPDPPIVPEISGECEFTSVKIRWDSSPNMNYKLVRINEHGQYISIYEGEMNQTRAKGLKENTRYVFKLRVLHTQTKAETWSEEFEFITHIAPPPTVKNIPTISLVAGTTHSYRVEWQQSFSQDSLEEHFYRLQTCQDKVKGAKWENAYEGTHLNFVLNTKEFPGALHVRVLCVRKQNNSEQCGSPSPVGYIANDPPKIETEEVEPVVAQANWYSNPISLGAIIICCLVLFASFFPWVNAYIRGLMDPTSRR